MESRVFTVQGKQESRGEQANTAGKLTPSQFYLSSSHSSLCHLVTPPLLRASCPGIQQPVPEKLRCPASYPVSRSLAGRPGLHTLVPSIYQNFSKPRLGRRALPGRDTPKGQERTTVLCVPPASCLLCIAFVSLFMTTLESWLLSPWLCWGKAQSPLALMLLQGLQGCA